MGQVLLLERTVLEIAHDRIKLGHRVAYGSTGCKDHATPAGQLIHIAHFINISEDFWASEVDRPATFRIFV